MKKRTSKEPWFWAARKAYYITIKKKKIRLSADKEEAGRKYHSLMAKDSSAGESLQIKDLCDLYLDDAKKQKKAAESIEYYEIKFAQFNAKYPSLTVSTIRPHHVKTWALSKTAPSTQRNCIQSIKAAMRFGKADGYYEGDNPIALLKPPAAGARNVWVKPDEFAKILTFVKSEPFKQLLIFTYETGARPVEVVRLEKRHFDEPNSRFVIPKLEAKGKRSIRYIYLNDNCLRIVKELVEKHPTGKLFRTVNNEPFNRNRTSAHFERVQARQAKAFMIEHNIKRNGKLTRAQIQKYATRYNLYSFRHSFANNALDNGIDGLTVCNLMGHKDITMLARVYGHQEDNSVRLFNEVRKVNSLVD
jgi:integrase